MPRGHGARPAPRGHRDRPGKEPLVCTGALITQGLSQPASELPLVFPQTSPTSPSTQGAARCRREPPRLSVCYTARPVRGVALPSSPHFKYHISPIIMCGSEPRASPAHASNQPHAGFCGNCFDNAQERGRRATHGLPAGLRGSPLVTSSPACTAVCCPHIKSTWLTPLGEENLFF